MRKIFFAALVSVIFCSCTGTKENNLSNGSFDSAAGWKVANCAEVTDGQVVVSLVIPKYNTQWQDFLSQTVALKENTDYVLCAKAKSSLKVLSSSMFIGVRFPDGRVMKDKEFLLFKDDMTPLSMEFNSGANNSLVVFCGAWVNQTVKFEIDDFFLLEK